MKTPYGYCDLRVERVNDDIIDAYIKHGYALIAVNTTVNCLLLGNGSSNKKKRKFAEFNDETEGEKDWVPTPKLINITQMLINLDKCYCDRNLLRDIIKTIGRLASENISINGFIFCHNFYPSTPQERSFTSKNLCLIIYVTNGSADLDNDSKLTILNRLTIQITNIGQLQKILSSPNFKLYNILAVEPLNDKVLQDIVTSPSVDIITCNMKTSLTPKDYSIAVEKNIYFEISYCPMLISSSTRQDTFTLAHLLYIKGKSKNLIITSGAANKLDIRNPHDVMNLGILLGLPKKQSTKSVTQRCYSIILKSYGRKLGKSAIHLKPMNNSS